MAHWLIKSEPSTYPWDQLVKDKRTSWTGVRNFQAAANLKAMKAGDRLFFYHSGEGKAVTVDVKAIEPVKQPVTLAAIKADPTFKEFKLVRQSRLSVVPVSDEHWKLIMKM